ncbi:hypothetical protein, partial [Acidaminobacter sp.]|uniref:hypothetical protein n=1 Tax=Acidaminobacter sp. TaxID=1872102 RepID=UPI0025BD1359
MYVFALCRLSFGDPIFVGHSPFLAVYMANYPTRLPKNSNFVVLHPHFAKLVIFDHESALFTHYFTFINGKITWPMSFFPLYVTLFIYYL